jgi:hypothetical protein
MDPPRRRQPRVTLTAIRTLYGRSAHYPFATNLSLTTIPVGLLAVIIGPEISRGFSSVFHRPELIYIWGVWMFVGGVNVAVGILRQHPAVERAGLYVLVVPLMFYGVFVVVGLGRGGLVTGPVFCGLAISCFQRAQLIARGTQERLVLRAALAESAGDEQPP